MKSLELKESYLGVNPSNLNKNENPEVLKCKIIKIPVLKYFQKAKGFRIRRLFKKTPSFQQPLGKPLSICSEPLGSPDFKGQCQGRHRVWKGKACCQQNGGEGLFGFHTCWLTLKSIEFILFCMVAKLWTQRSVGCSEH